MKQPPSIHVRGFMLGWLCLGILVTMIGCTNKHQELISDTDTDTDSKKTAKTNGPDYLFAIIYPYAHPIYESVTRKAEEAAARINARLIIKAPEEANLEQQIRMMDALVKQGVDGIAISPVDSEQLVPAINAAVNSGIPVICFESDVPDSQRHLYIGTNNYRSGQIMADVLVDILGQDGMIIIETGMRSMLAQQKRLESFLESLYKKTNITILDVRYNEGIAQKALQDMETMIENHPHFHALIALDPISASESILIWKAKGLKQILLVFGKSYETEEALNNGQITAIVSQGEDEWGKQIVEALFQLKTGKSVGEFWDTGTTVLEAFPS